MATDMLQDLQKDYVATFQSKIDLAQRALKEEQWDELHQLFHKLAGSGATYQMPEISFLGSLLDTYMNSSTIHDPKIMAEGVALLEEVLSSRQKKSEKAIEAHPFVIELKKNIQHH